MPPPVLQAHPTPFFGLRSYLSGTFNPATHALEDQPEPRIGYAKADVESLVGFASRPSYSGVDMLLTARWPAGVCAGAPAPGDATAARSNCVGSAAAAAALRPRYHFAAGCSAFYERQPYSNAVVGQPPRPATRFFGVAAVGNAAKERWLYAFNVEPMSAIDPATLLVPPASLTPSPYAIGRPPPPPPAAVQNSFFFGQQGGGGHAGERKRRRVEGGNRAPRPPQPTGPCWFCLGGAEVEKHLVTAIGKTVYVALAKGGLTKDHVLVLPIKHVPSSLALDDETRAEITEYKQALRTYFEKQGKACVMWERNMRSQHLQIQVCPIPQDAAAAAETVFRERGEAMGPSFKWQVLTPGTPLAEMFDGGGDPPYFLVTLPDGTELLHRISSGFPLQFARCVPLQRFHSHVSIPFCSHSVTTPRDRR
jgi:diadenosine tetraphosphate (Ap4A) HIT family hydrolase